MSGVVTQPCPSPTAPCPARLSGHQCPLDIVSVGSTGAVKQQKVVEGGELEVWQHQGSPDMAALRISRHLFGGGSGGPVRYGGGGTPRRCTISTFT